MHKLPLPLKKQPNACALPLGLSLFLGLFLTLLPNASYAQALDAKACHALLKAAPKIAAECYVRVAQHIQINDQSSLIDRKQKALLLENAAKSYEQAANRSKVPEQRAYLFEQSGIYLRQILTEKLCFKVYRCKSIQGLLYQVQQETGYSNVTLLNPRKKPVEVEIRGHQYEKKVQVTDRWSGSLRPGTYTFRATYTGSPSRTMQTTIPPRKDQLIYTSPVGTPIPTGAWLLAGFGAAIGAIGATALVITFGSIRIADYDRLQDYAKDARDGNLSESGYKTAVDGLRRANDIYNSVQPLQAVGWIAVGVGSAAALGALIWMFVPRKPTAGQSIAAHINPSKLPLLANTKADAPPHILYKSPTF